MRWPGREQDRCDQHIVDTGRVWCHRRGRDVDVDRCYDCGAFEHLARESDLQILHCRPPGGWAEFEGFMAPR